MPTLLQVLDADPDRTSLKMLELGFRWTMVLWVTLNVIITMNLM